jgi:hypothetical protein
MFFRGVFEESFQQDRVVSNRMLGNKKTFSTFLNDDDPNENVEKREEAVTMTNKRKFKDAPQVEVMRWT